MFSMSCFVLTALFTGVVADDGVGLIIDYTRNVSGLLTVNNPYDAGTWGKPQFCPPDSFVHSIAILLQPKGTRDETAVNAIKLYCRAENQTYDNNYVISARSFRGNWCDTQVCTKGFMTGFRARVRPKGGMFIDDTALQDFQGQCRASQQLLMGVPPSQQFRSGQWSRWAECPLDSAVCGLKTRVQSFHSFLDDIAVTDAQLYCCPLNS
ncbi:Vitelline membrane outer layer protein I (VOMI) [Trinorchestia longiramus]|nr:Vitelline membrane outer layer protein I (VOMI) [Trinorchestia longiramus]